MKNFLGDTVEMLVQVSLVLWLGFIVISPFAIVFWLVSNATR